MIATLDVAFTFQICLNVLIHHQKGKLIVICLFLILRKIGKNSVFILNPRAFLAHTPDSVFAILGLTGRKCGKKLLSFSREDM